MLAKHCSKAKRKTEQSRPPIEWLVFKLSQYPTAAMVSSCTFSCMCHKSIESSCVVRDKEELSKMEKSTLIDTHLHTQRTPTELNNRASLCSLYSHRYVRTKANLPVSCARPLLGMNLCPALQNQTNGTKKDSSCRWDVRNNKVNLRYRWDNDDNCGVWAPNSNKSCLPAQLTWCRIRWEPRIVNPACDSSQLDA